MSPGTKKPPVAPLVTSTVLAGFPSPAEQYVEEPLDLNELLVAHPAATFFVRAAGDSMTGAGIRPGDILVVDRSLEARDGAVVIASVDNEFTVKFLRKDAEGVRLEAANRRYKPIVFSEEMELRIFGVVTAVIHRFPHPAASAPHRSPAPQPPASTPLRSPAPQPAASAPPRSPVPQPAVAGAAASLASGAP